MKRSAGFLILFLVFASFQLGMGHRNPAQYDEEARQAEREAKAQRKITGSPDESKAQDAIDVVEPKAQSDDTTKIRFKIPGA